MENIAFTGAAQAHLCLLVWHVIIRSDATIVATAWTHLLTVSSNGVSISIFLVASLIGRWFVGPCHRCSNGHCNVPVAEPVVLMRTFAIYDLL
jgi:hypothetical protein